MRAEVEEREQGHGGKSELGPMGLYSKGWNVMQLGQDVHPVGNLDPEVGGWLSCAWADRVPRA